ncbi:MAG: SagB/ThcOx family dehydrogenase [Thermodesulfobacteriota bacterium]|nr:MAG: SagB/ThcOx family dehydrogenase [Thermodesulfobacteriota bacterium]
MVKTAEGVIRYHERTKHRPGRYAKSPGFLDWENQPQPFRCFKGSPAIKLPFLKKDPAGDFSSLFSRKGCQTRPFNLENIGAFLELSLGLSAWKSYMGESWPLRMNPSSGNLHAEECYLALPPLTDDGSMGGIFHYNPFYHHLEKRAESGEDLWDEIKKTLGTNGFLAGLASVFWREEWKYGERAFRYSNLDLGHGAACMSFSAALLGWKLTSLSALSDDGFEKIFGFDRTRWVEGERDFPGPLFLVHPKEKKPESKILSADIIERFKEITFTGEPEPLSKDHVDWPAVKEVSMLTAKPSTQPLPCPRPCEDAQNIKEETDASGAEIIRRRRSGQAYDGATSVPKEDLFAILDGTLPRSGFAPFDMCLGETAVHLVIFVHRVAGLKPGLYILVRDNKGIERLKQDLHGDFLWSGAGEKKIPLYLLKDGLFAGEARFICCNQDIAGDGAVCLAMIARFREVIEKAPWLYRHLHWEAGVTGQALYLGAEARGLRATGIGCFHDDIFHEFVGLNKNTFQSLYHFTIGTPVEDRRITTLAAYHHLKESGLTR